ncbi:hypothetical protein PR202_gb11239 [Eleusine coracana subsp. coracana]|uniref:Phytanoyl-CoA dioxygenase n=1 Tax=Eleusine coracana subsp. coracana TaxID=191504 RepID=A0AAV5EM65_ELECO|nr:hypothetical protein PR202_gb11239 [Eleusine coracana subsp. coracana]
MPPAGSLTADQLSFFDTNGQLLHSYSVFSLCLPSNGDEFYCSEEEVREMRDRMAELVSGFDGANSTVFSTKDHVRRDLLFFSRQLKDDYFFKSAENISFFFEENAFGDDGSLKQAKELSINKVGHGYKRPAIMQCMYIFKVLVVRLCHQDSTFLYTEPRTCTGLWLALQDATISNGCLWAIPGSHKKGLIRRMIRDENGTHFDRPFPSYDQKDFVPLEVKSGAMVVIHGDLIHQSFENHSPVSRHALSLHVVDTEGCEWSKDNWPYPVLRAPALCGVWGRVSAAGLTPACAMRGDRGSNPGPVGYRRIQRTSAPEPLYAS